MTITSIPAVRLIANDGPKNEKIDWDKIKKEDEAREKARKDAEEARKNLPPEDRGQGTRSRNDW